MITIARWVNAPVQLIGGFICFFNCIWKVLTLNVTSIIISLYIILFGLVLLLHQLGISKVKQYFGFLDIWVSEAVFLIFLGTLGIATGAIFGYIIGAVSCVAGVLCIIDRFAVGKRLINGQGAAA
ncbi:hypothetical protein STCU_10708 [Strigomonas culicis]|uniref:Uncharacterized protein n=1 Tax=Strigomonas culicis TaxID=28005 RepID=S9TKC5_9TRYP|nr:hypothetical protein STCU_10708 [Strigomonas culicis]|eukprot:EPY17289.1 hypothetical protein STCU_10708 [Strigomonas culicis]